LKIEDDEVGSVEDTDEEEKRREECYEMFSSISQNSRRSCWIA
jgi:hypothetical protein